MNHTLIPTDAAPEETAANAYSICTNFPDGLRIKNWYEYICIFPQRNLSVPEELYQTQENIANLNVVREKE